MTRKKQSFPCYGMQWGPSIYLYPVEESLVEQYKTPPKPAQVVEAKMYGARWQRESNGTWKLIWTERAIKDFYLNNILIHELGHLLDDRNTRSIDRERYAEWFAVEYGYKPTRRQFAVPQAVVRRHHRPKQLRRVAVLSKRLRFWERFSSARPRQFTVLLRGRDLSLAKQICPPGV